MMYAESSSVLPCISSLGRIIITARRYAYAAYAAVVYPSVRLQKLANFPWYFVPYCGLGKLLSSTSPCSQCADK